MVLVFHNVTKQRKAEQELLQSDVRLKKTQEIAHLGAWELDLTKDQLYWSDEIYRIFGLAPQEFGATYEAFLGSVHPEDRAAVDQAYTGSIREGRDTYEIEHRVVRHSTGEIRTVQEKCEHLRDENGRIIRSIGMVQDVTERKQAEMRLLEERDFSAALVDSLPGVFYLFDAEGHFLRWNRNFERVTGYAPDEIARLHPLDLFQGEGREHIAARIGEVFRQGQATAEADFVFKNGSRAPYFFTGQRVALPQGPCLVGMGIDITERKEREQENLKLNRMLRALSDCNQVMLRAQDEGQLMAEVCRIIVNDCGYALAWIGLAEHNPKKTVRPVASAGFESGYLETLKITWADTRRGQGPTGIAIRTGEVALCRNILTDPQFAPWREEALKRGYASSMALPLSDGGRAFGALMIYSQQADPFSEDEVRLLSELASDLAYGISSRRLLGAQARADRIEREWQDKAAQIEVQRRLINQREEERTQIAREIHDGPVQELTAATLTLQGMILDSADPRQAEALESIKANLRAAITELRGYAQELRPPTLSKFGLETAIRAHLETFLEKHPELAIDFVPQRERRSLEIPDSIGIALYRIVQEALTNIVKHAHANRVTIAYRETPIQVLLEITDDGVGFTPPTDWVELAQQGHLGLVGIRERVEAVHGNLKISSRPHHGSRIRVVVHISRMKEV